MNFQAVRQANGNKVTMGAIATKIDGVSYTQQKGTPKQNCTFTDANGEAQSVTIYQGNKQPIPQNLQGTTISINISAQTNEQSGKTYYGGFWNSNAQVMPIAPQPNAQQPQQGPSQAAGRPNVPQQGSADPRGLSIERQCAFKAACTLYQGLHDIPISAVIDMAKAGAYFIETGNNLADIPDMPTEEQIPF